MIRHEAVSANPQMEPTAAFPQQFDVKLAVGIITKNIQSPDASLSDMQRYPGEDNTRDPWHGIRRRPRTVGLCCFAAPKRKGN
jgi:hypothetical protein